MTIQKSYEYTDIIRLYRNPMTIQKSDELTEILRLYTGTLRIQMNHTNSQKYT